LYPRCLPVTGSSGRNIIATAAAAPRRRGGSGDNDVKLQRNPLHDHTTAEGLADSSMAGITLMANPLVPQYRPPNTDVNPHAALEMTTILAPAPIQPIEVCAHMCGHWLV